MGHPRLIASVNEQRGTVSVVLEPKPYWTRNEAEAEVRPMDELTLNWRALEESERFIPHELVRSICNGRIDEDAPTVSLDWLDSDHARQVLASEAVKRWHALSDKERRAAVGAMLREHERAGLIERGHDGRWRWRRG